MIQHIKDLLQQINSNYFKWDLKKLFETIFGFLHHILMATRIYKYWKNAANL